jgi:hypothetical protein
MLEPAQRCSDGTTSQTRIIKPSKPTPVNTRFLVFDVACTVTSCADVSAIFNFCVPDLLYISDAALHHLVTWKLNI